MAGLDWQFGQALQSAGRFNFSGCKYNVMLHGDAQAGAYELRNAGQYLHQDAGTSALNLKSGSSMSFLPGSDLRTVGDNRFTIDAGASADFQQATTDMSGRINVNAG